MPETGSGVVSGGGECDPDGKDLCEDPLLASLSPRLRARFERKREEDLRLTRDAKAEIQALLPDGSVFFDEAMSKHTSMGVGGAAECFIVARDIQLLKAIMGWAVDHEVNFFFWGGGCNTLVKDGGVGGIVVNLGEGFENIVKERETDEEVYIKVGAAVTTQRLLKYCSDNGYSGLEFLAGVWGTFGGNIKMNAGTRDGSIEGVIEEVTVVDKNMRELSMKKSALKFEYRALKLPSTTAIVGALIKLSKGKAEDVAAKIGELLNRRAATQPKGERSFGCIFKNTGKTPAGMLIDEAGFKGVRVGGARVSNIHANFIVNEGKAKAKDILVLINLIKERVKEKTGIVLETEIEIIGEDK